MPRRSRVSLDDIAALDTLARAFWQAGRAKRGRDEVRGFSSNLDAELARLHDDILDGRAPEGRWTCFFIHDPKSRRILAPCFRDRMLHHDHDATHGPCPRAGARR